MPFAGAAPQCRHLPDPVPVEKTDGWLTIEDVARAMGHPSLDFIGASWNHWIAETWATGETTAGRQPIRMALCTEGLVDSWCLDARDMPAIRQEYVDREHAREVEFEANRQVGPTGPRTKDWLSFAQFAKRLGLSGRDASLGAFWLSVTHPVNVDRRGEAYMRGVRAEVRTDPKTEKSFWCLYEPHLERFAKGYEIALRTAVAPKPRPAGSLTCGEGWALFGKDVSWDTYFTAWNFKFGMRGPPKDEKFKTLGEALAVARNVLNVHSPYGRRYTPISILMNHVEKDLRPTVRSMLREMDDAGTEGAIGPLAEKRPVVIETYVDGVPLLSVMDEMKDRFMAEARRRVDADSEPEAEPSGPRI